MRIHSNVVIIGAGVAGMTAAIYLKRAGIDSVIIEKEIPGGQILKAFSVENYPGFVKITGKELSDNMVEQLKKLEINYIKDEAVDIVTDNEDKVVVLKSGEKIGCKAVILAVGRHPKKLGIPKLSSFVGNGLSYCATCDGRLYKDKDVMVVGGSNSALEEAVYLSNICKTVTIVHRRDEFRAEKTWQDEVKNIENINIEYNAVLKELVKEEDVLSSAILKYNDGNEKEFRIQGCFSSIGYEPDTDILENIVKLDDEGYIDTDSYGKTSVEGIYAAGDTVKKGIYQLITAMNDAVVVADSVREYLK